MFVIKANVCVGFAAARSIGPPSLHGFLKHFLNYWIVVTIPFRAHLARASPARLIYSIGTSSARSARLSRNSQRA